MTSDDLRSKIEALADSIEGDSGVAHNYGCEGEPDCLACIVADLRRTERAEGAREALLSAAEVTTAPMSAATANWLQARAEAIE